jgi:hypothetical protein
MATLSNVIDAVRKGEIVAVVLVDTTETLGSTIKEVVPYIQAGISYVIVDTYLHTVLSNARLSTKEAQDKLSYATTGQVVSVDGLTVKVFVVDLVEVDDNE